MKQISLNLNNSLNYQAGFFYSHAGVKEILEAVLAGYQQEIFSRFFITGSSRSGKTHLAFKLADLALQLGKFAKVISGDNFSDWINTQYEKIEADNNTVIIVDDLDCYFKTGSSGEFVSFYETLRLCKAKLVLLSNCSINTMNVDNHIASRLQSGGALEIFKPEDHDLKGLLRLMARQRGIELSQRSIEYLEKRIGRTIQDIEAHLNRLLAHSQHLSQPIKFAMLSDIL